jgi:two-component system phosphate regulon sensor histidine kinase PhoR
MASATDERKGQPSEQPAIQALIEALPDAALLLDARGMVWLANAEARNLLAISETQRPISYFLRAPDVLDAIALAGKGQPGRVRYHERVPFDRWIEAHTAPLPVDNGETRGSVLVVLRDLTKAEQLERMRADFVANASHELRTPLATLSGFIETLQGPARDDAAARERFLVIMQTQANRMSRLISDLLSLSRIELDEHVRPETKADLGEITAQVVDSLRPMAEEEDVTIIFDRPGPVPVIGARDELARVVENLVENAIKYAASGKRIAVGAAVERIADKPQAVLRVRDFGPGIAPEHLPRLTERFYRVNVGESRAKGGTGLGLAIVKHIVSRHRGTLQIASTQGEGATFTVRFDLAE